MSNPRPSRWLTTPPVTWPDAPADMTVSTLNDIEACPRRWALGAASYPQLWDGRGYPPRANPRALAGSLVHTVLEIITKELVRAGCPSIQDAAAVGIMQRVGGFSKVITDAIAVLTGRLSANPRVSQQLEQIGRALRAQIGDIRLRVQTMLSRRQLPVRQRTSGTSEFAQTRTALGFGVYCELELRAPLIRWKGKADLLTFTAELCELTDFKTGERSDEHRFQVVAYALLWSRDGELNPSKRLADRLVLAYPDGDVAMDAPSASALDAFERELVQRSDTARLSLTQLPPQARPGIEVCRYCAVRHLCDAYWKSPELVAFRPDKTYGDLEATVTRRHGPTSWDIVVESSPDRATGLLRTNVGVEFRIGERVRILDGAIKLPEAGSSDPIVVTAASATEMFEMAAS